MYFLCPKFHHRVNPQNQPTRTADKNKVNFRNTLAANQQQATTSTITELPSTQLRLAIRFMYSRGKTKCGVLGTNTLHIQTNLHTFNQRRRVSWILWAEGGWTSRTRPEISATSWRDNSPMIRVSMIWTWINDARGGMIRTTIDCCYLRIPEESMQTKKTDLHDRTNVCSPSWVQHSTERTKKSGGGREPNRAQRAELSRGVVALWWARVELDWVYRHTRQQRNRGAHHTHPLFGFIGESGLAHAERNTPARARERTQSWVWVLSVGFERVLCEKREITADRMVHANCWTPRKKVFSIDIFF